MKIKYYKSDFYLFREVDGKLEILTIDGGYGYTGINSTWLQQIDFENPNPFSSNTPMFIEYNKLQKELFYKDVLNT